MARVGNGETKSLAISAGKHKLSLKISWFGSNTVRFEISEDQSLRFSCGSSLRGARLLLVYYYVPLLPMSICGSKRSSIHITLESSPAKNVVCLRLGLFGLSSVSNVFRAI